MILTILTWNAQGVYVVDLEYFGILSMFYLWTNNSIAFLVKPLN